MELGVCYYPEHWDESMWEQDAQNMVDLGIKKVRIGEFAWSKLEPKAGEYQWEWLDKAIDILGKAGLDVILGTPTATPPKWLINKYPAMLALDKNGHKRHFGSRRHYSFSSLEYKNECARIVTLMAERYGENPYVTAWQTDNEYGCHQTTYDYSENAQQAFRLWLKQKYGSVQALNQAWGNVFWSMEYTDFNEVDLPNLTVTEANPAHSMDFRRFSSDQVRKFNQLQVEILRKHSPNRDIIHNFMGNFTDFNHFDVGADLDVSSWDSYPLGFLDVFIKDSKQKQSYMRIGHPEIGAFHHDLYRATGKGRMWVMELQPGPVNWAPYNPIPANGAMRLWGWEALAHGAEVVSYFRWRQAPWAQEQMHAGLRLPNDEPAIASDEILQLYQELSSLPKDMPTEQADVAIIFDYEAAWMMNIQPHAKEMDYLTSCLDIYREIRSCSLNVDILPQGAPLDGYKAVFIPPTAYIKDETVKELAAFSGMVLVSCRTGSRNKNFAIPDNLAPGNLADLLGVSVKVVDSVRPDMGGKINWYDSHEHFNWHLWREIVVAEEGTKILSYFTDTDTPAIIENNNFTYMACLGGRSLLGRLVRRILRKAGVHIEKIPDCLRIRKRGDYAFAFNYGREAVVIPMANDMQFIVGEQHLKPNQVAIWRIRS